MPVFLELNVQDLEQPAPEDQLHAQVHHHSDGTFTSSSSCPCGPIRSVLCLRSQSQWRFPHTFPLRVVALCYRSRPGSTAPCRRASRPARCATPAGAAACRAAPTTRSTSVSIRFLYSGLACLLGCCTRAVCPRGVASHATRLRRLSCSACASVRDELTIHQLRLAHHARPGLLCVCRLDPLDGVRHLFRGDQQPDRDLVRLPPDVLQADRGPVVPVRRDGLEREHGAGGGLGNHLGHHQ